MIIDPESPRSEGYDAEGEPVQLGDIDGLGYYVGWIDEDGLAWESRCEREITLSSGAFRDDWMRWNRCGGLVGNEPSPIPYIRDYCSPDSEDEALRECEETISPDCPVNKMTSERAAYYATLN